jgi:signal transduction histidine kinase
MLNMRKEIEPGLLQVFRWFAGVRLTLAILALGGQFFLPDDRGRFELNENNLPFLIAALVWMLLLVIYLNWKPIQPRLGRAYLPIGILIAAIGLLLEPYVLTPIARFWQPDAFLFILLILVAWQFDLPIVIFFVIAIAGSEALLNEILPQANTPFLIPREFQAFDKPIVYGRLLTRSSSFVILGLVINRLVRSQREQRVALEDANRQLVRHSSTLEQLATSRERNRLSRELHDTVAHTLSGLTVQLEALNTAWKKIPAKAQAMVDLMLQTTRDGLNETRRTLKNLRAAPLEDMGLALAIQALAEDFAKRNNWKADLDIQTDLDDIDPEIEQTFYRIAQESLENVARHANAKKVKLLLSQTKQTLRLSVEDNGSGFEADSVDQNERLGIQLLQERAELIGAKLQVKSQLGKGTKVDLRY